MSGPAAATLVRPYVFSAPVKGRIKVDCARTGCRWSHSFSAPWVAAGDVYDHLREHSYVHATP